MNLELILFTMIFCHIVDDYYLQGWLASAKQKSWWEQNAPQDMYKNDWIWALLMHAFSWTFMIMLPITLNYDFTGDERGIFSTMFCVNWIVHAVVDDLKANQKVINLWQDQIIHLIQIFVTAFMCHLYII